MMLYHNRSRLNSRMTKQSKTGREMTEKQKAIRRRQKFIDFEMLTPTENCEIVHYVGKGKVVLIGFLGKLVRWSLPSRNVNPVDATLSISKNFEIVGYHSTRVPMHERIYQESENHMARCPIWNTVGKGRYNCMLQTVFFIPFLIDGEGITIIASWTHLRRDSNQTGWSTEMCIVGCVNKIN